MDTPALPVGHFEDGERYLAALETLGLRPNAFFWAFDRVTDGFVLVLVADAFDAVGPFELSKLLFRAYNAEATPRAIDPFVVRLHSPRHRIVDELNERMSLEAGFRATVADGSLDREGNTTSRRAITSVDGLEIERDWVYRFDKPLVSNRTSNILRQWHRFERNVDRIAA